MSRKHKDSIPCHLSHICVTCPYKSVYQCKYALPTWDNVSSIKIVLVGLCKLFKEFFNENRINK